MGRMCVAKSVQIPPNPNPFLIDATEVTRGQYAAWLATNPNPADIWQDATCSWNASFTPDTACMARSSVCKGADCANHPQVCIDMCDAVAYCRAIGKHLCSAYEWSNACTSNGVNQFTYGNSIGVGQCHDTTEPNSSTTVPVGTMPECQSPVPGFAGIFDLIGNVSEWVADCTGSAGATCRTAANLSAANAPISATESDFAAPSAWFTSLASDWRLRLVAPAAPAGARQRRCTRARICGHRLFDKAAIVHRKIEQVFERPGTLPARTCATSNAFAQRLGVLAGVPGC
jgi:formylglycine-generating enzyme required for sulfatase activity